MSGTSRSSQSSRQTAKAAAPGVFEMLKIGIGPSSSHTLGPWKAAQAFSTKLKEAGLIDEVTRVEVDLYGSLALTGKGHGTDIAVMMGLSGCDPVSVPLEEVQRVPAETTASKTLELGGESSIDFDPDTSINFLKNDRLKEHPNGMKFRAFNGEQLLQERTGFSVGGGFVVWQGEQETKSGTPSLYELTTGEQLLNVCRIQGKSIAHIARENEASRLAGAETSAKGIDEQLADIWDVMLQAVYRGCTTQGKLPGYLGVSRRAAEMSRGLTGAGNAPDLHAWLNALSDCHKDFSRVLKLVGCFAMAVNEENAAFGRIVTAPTNGSAGVIPAVLMYYCYLCDNEGRRQPSAQSIGDFLLVAATIGGIFKTGATISAAMGGCQAEIGVSSAMAAGALVEVLGGTPSQALMAAEIAMEHHLGLTCDPIGGFVQIPCIERNSMGAMKAITAAHIALESDSALAKVSLDEVVRTMWTTAQDMNSRYKETSLGGLAVNVSVRIADC